MTEHSKTPWEYAYSEDADTIAIRSAPIPTKGFPAPVMWDIAYMAGGSPDRNEKESNAAHIVHCVNTHDALEAKLGALVKAALKLVEIDIRPLKSQPRDVCGGVSELMDIDQERKTACDALSALLAEIREGG
jgi:hypothetical protein